jgi:hypothetical protein
MTIYGRIMLYGRLISDVIVSLVVGFLGSLYLTSGPSPGWTYESTLGPNGSV